MPDFEIGGFDALGSLRKNLEETGNMYETPDYKKSVTLEHEVDIGGSSGDGTEEEGEASSENNEEQKEDRKVSVEGHSDLPVESGPSVKPEVGGSKKQGRPVSSDGVKSSEKGKKEDKASPLNSGRGRPPVKGREYKHLSQFPSKLLDFVKSEIGCSVNRAEDALAVYIYRQSGGRAPVSDEIKELSQSLPGDKTLQEMGQQTQNIDNRMMRMERGIMAQNQLLKELEFALGYVIYDRLGFRQDNPSVPAETKIDGPGLPMVLKSLRSDFKIYSSREAAANGRPYR